MKKFLTYYLIAFTSAFLLSVTLKAQCPINFPETSTFCFTNNSDYHDGGYFAAGACTYEICVKIKPKASCYPECEYVSPDGYRETYCVIVAVGETQCINIPTTHNPITDCWDVVITMKVVGHSETMTKNLIPDLDQVGEDEQIHDHCLESETWYSVLERLSGTSNEFNFRIHTRGIPGYGY